MVVCSISSDEMSLDASTEFLLVLFEVPVDFFSLMINFVLLPACGRPQSFNCEACSAFALEPRSFS